MECPIKIKLKLDEYVIGHYQTKKALAVAAYSQSKIRAGKKIKKTNVMLIGPTGCGKTYLVSTLAQVLNVDFLITDATKFTASGYSGRNVEEIVSDLMSLCEYDENRAKQAIVYIDEVDKIKKHSMADNSPDVNGVGVQQALLKLLEGGEVSYVSKYSRNGEHDRKLDTKNIMFICSGAFVGLESVSTENLVKFGMIPEFLGRFSTITKLSELTMSDYREILLNSKDSVLNSFREWFLTEDVEVIVSDTAVQLIAERAIEKGLGARGLQGVLDEIFLDAQYELPSLPNKPQKLIIDDEVVLSGKPKWSFV